MDENLSHDKCCTEQHFAHGTPNPEWLPEQLIAYVRALQGAIEDDERALAVKYWRMGVALNLLRRSFTHGQWEQFLSGAKLEKSKASRSRAIARTFAREEELTGLTVKDAYAKRSRKPPAQKRTEPTSTEREPTGLAKFFKTVAREAESLADEAGFAEQAAAVELLKVADAALSNVLRLRDLLRQQAGHAAA